MIDVVTIQFRLRDGQGGPRVEVAVVRQARGDSGVYDYGVSIDGERRGLFFNDGGLYRLQDVTGRNVRGVPVAIGSSEFERAVAAGLALGLLPTLARAVARVPGDPEADRQRVASAVRVLDSLAFVELADVADEVLITEAYGVTVGLIRSLLDGYAQCRQALTVSL